MIKIDCEYKRGILFVRLTGEVNKTTIKNMDIVDNIIRKAGIKYLLINLEKTIIIRHKDISNLISRYKELIGDDGKLVICGYYNPTKINIKIEDTDKVYLSGKEVSAFNIINI